MALKHSGATLLNQSVLLRGVNDSHSALVALSRRLMDCGVLPYYLHMLDPVSRSRALCRTPRRGRDPCAQY